MCVCVCVCPDKEYTMSMNTNIIRNVSTILHEVNCLKCSTTVCKSTIYLNLKDMNSMSILATQFRNVILFN